MSSANLSTAMDDTASLAQYRKSVADMEQELEDISRKKAQLEQKLEQWSLTLKETAARTWRDDSLVCADVRYAVSGEPVALVGSTVKLQKTMTVESLRSCIAVAAGQKECGLFFAKLGVIFNDKILTDDILLSHVASPEEAAQDLKVVHVTPKAGTGLKYPGYDSAQIVQDSMKVPSGFPHSGTPCPECGKPMWSEERSYYWHSDICSACQICVGNDMGGP